METFTWKQIILMVCMLITGAITTLSKKAQFDTIAKGWNSLEHSFNHPWFQTWMLCAAQSFCLIGIPILRRREAKHQKRQVAHKEQNDTLLNIQEGPSSHARICQWIIIIPACTSVIATSLVGIGLLYVDASIMLMLKGSVIISTGLFSHVFLNRKLKVANWIGIAVVIVGLVLAGCSSVFKNQDHKTNGGKATTDVQHYVGLKGIYGLVVMTFIILPAMYFIPGGNADGSFENSIDALYQITNSTKLLSFCLLYLIAVAIYNITSIAVMRSLSAVHSTLIDACRTIMVWAVGMTIYYGFDKNFGEPFDKYYGILQIDGFLFLVIGTLIYKNVLELRNFVPCWKISSETNSQTIKSENGCKDNTLDSENNYCHENSPLLTENKA
ncbi:solute carrier family 35 member F6-like isoform X2 [Ruditapes philippinarum]|uniref:solute carrier family 35 member F6-like isoform X2 n=1 Tax=Ruditapes philippinarum TaxID=129788 RepID=UPI00295B6E13|nr:solute carrier family 35 member F6-like isoform X2 [Ruditapes philippinarum]